MGLSKEARSLYNSVSESAKKQMADQDPDFKELWDRDHLKVPEPPAVEDQQTRILDLYKRDPRPDLEIPVDILDLAEKRASAAAYAARIDPSRPGYRRRPAEEPDPDPEPEYVSKVPDYKGKRAWEGWMDLADVNSLWAEGGDFTEYQRIQVKPSDQELADALNRWRAENQAAYESLAAFRPRIVRPVKPGWRLGVWSWVLIGTPAILILLALAGK